jgi:calcineurin-like phosphoesterase family protein
MELTPNIFFTSDNHFGHKGILKHCPDTREGATVAEMDEIMIERWNARIPPNGTVFCIGDFTFYTNKDKIVNILERLNGQIHLIKGNHCYFIDQDPALFMPYFESVQDYKRIKIDKVKIELFHYPIQEWRGAHKGDFHLFGHVHGSIPETKYRRMDVGIDTRPGMTPYTWKEIYETLIVRAPLEHHGKVAE